MNICHVITRLIIGGAQENTILTCRGLVEGGHNVTLVAGPETGPEGSLWDLAKRAGCDLIRVASLRRAVNPVRDFLAYRQLRSFFGRLRPDVVHTHSSKAGVLGREAAWRSGVGVVVHTIHGMSFNRTQSRTVQAFYRRLERHAATRTTAFVSVADAMTEQAVLAGIAPRDRFTTIRSGMDTEPFTPDPEMRAGVRAEWNIGEEEIVVGTIARLFANKGYEAIIEAMSSAVAAVPRLRFVWIGDGPHRLRYETRLESMGLSRRVHLVGLVPPHEVPRLVHGFDIVLHASRWEGLPRAVVQGLLAEVPAISFDIDGAAEVVITEEAVSRQPSAVSRQRSAISDQPSGSSCQPTGILVPYGDTNGLAGALIRLAGDPALRGAFGRAGRKRCLTLFDWRTMVNELESLYEKLHTKIVNETSKRLNV